MLNKTVSEIMTPKACTVHMNEGIDKAIHLFLQHGVSILPVINTAGCCVGVVTFQDLIKRQNDECNEHLWGSHEAQEADPTTWLKETLVGDVMSTDFFWLSRYRTVAECIDMLVNETIHHVPVLDDEKRLVGVVSPHDVLQAIQELRANFENCTQ